MSRLKRWTGAAWEEVGYQPMSEKGAANGYASLGAGGLVPMAQLATGTPDGTKFVRDDGTLVAPGGGMTNPMTTAADIIVGGTAGAPARLAKGADSQVLTVDPTTHLIVWATPAASSGDVATDTIWDAKGDLAGGTGANTAARLPVGTDGHVLTAASAEVTGMKWAAAAGGGGTSFPVSPSTGDQYFRTDLGMTFFWDGTRWLCTCLHQIVVSYKGAESYANTTIVAWRGGTDYLTTTGIWYEDFISNFHVAGGTALSTSHKWVADLYLFGKDGGVASTLASQTIDAGASSQYRRAVVAIDSAVDMDSYAVIAINITKTGTPGTLYMWPLVTYRHIAT